MDRPVSMIYDIIIETLRLKQGEAIRLKGQSSRSLIQSWRWVDTSAFRWGMNRVYDRTISINRDWLHFSHGTGATERLLWRVKSEKRPAAILPCYMLCYAMPFYLLPKLLKHGGKKLSLNVFVTGRKKQCGPGTAKRPMRYSSQYILLVPFVLKKPSFYSVNTCHQMPAPRLFIIPCHALKKRPSIFPDPSMTKWRRQQRCTPQMPKYLL